MKIIFVVLASAGACIAYAQPSTQVRTAGPILGGPFDAAIVTGRPFTAEVVVESKQTLADGSQVVSQQTVMAARDTQGRTRREEVLASPGSGQQPKTVFISDPVAQMTYVLGPDHVARKLPMSAPGSAPQGGQRVQRFSTSGAATGRSEPEDAKTESLGSQTIAGAQAEGSRTTFTIPAGVVGNQNPLVISDERWYSQELQITVLSRHFDPRFGESSYRLTSIQQAEPPVSLFQIPSDYTVEAIQK
jgi:hypothetical protein